MTILDDIKAEVASIRETRKKPTKGRQIYELNLWLGAQRKALDAEYAQRMAEIESGEEPSLEDEISPTLLSLVAQAKAQGESRTSIRRALGKKTLDEADEFLELAMKHIHEEIETGAVAAYILEPTGQVHVKGWPMYAVTLVESGTTHSAVYLVTSGTTKGVQRRHLRISPSPAGSDEILDEVFASGAAAEMFARGKP